MAKEINDERIITALLTCGTIRAAAKAADVSERTIYDRMKNGDFQILYRQAKADLMRAAVFNINNKLQDAINTVSEIMTDTENSAATRLQAAQVIINNAGKFMQRLQSDETSIDEQIQANYYRL